MTVDRSRRLVLRSARLQDRHGGPTLRFYDVVPPDYTNPMLGDGPPICEPITFSKWEGR